MVCKYHDELIEKINKIVVDVALIKDSTHGPDSSLSKLVNKVAKHDMWFYIAYGCLICVGYALAQIGVFLS